jgi:NAD(P)-dependent dehydrogenase (short-subunit alcohol dehydrogenase family)
VHHPGHGLRTPRRGPDGGVLSRAVLVTGGARGLGRGIAQAFADAGDQVVVCGRNAGDGPGRFVACDVRDPEAVEALIADVMAHEGRLDVVLNIGSVSAIRPAPGTAAYAAAKAGLTTLTRALALEWAPTVRVNQVTVGLLATERTQETYGDDLGRVEATVPMGRLATVEDVAAACLALASPALAYVTGADLFVDGGGEVPAFHAALGGPGA